MVEILVLLAAAVVAVLLFTRLHLGSVLGYLAAGALIGPAGVGWITDADALRHIGEFGVVFLLFIIGVEIKPQRLWVMRRLVFGLGGAQVLLTGLGLAAAFHYGFALGFATALIMGLGLALSSTAFGVQLLSEKNQLTSHWGRSSFAILLFQDLAVVPLMVLVPLLAGGGMALTSSMGLAVLEAAAIFAAVLVGGRIAVGPLLHAIARSRNSDAFVAVALLLVLGFAFIMEQVGLSMAMGAFIAGVLLADSEYRHQVEADVQPFRGLLLGLFFMSVGMSLNPQALADHWGLVLGGTAALLAVKAVAIAGLARVWGLPLDGAVRAGLLLGQAGEFGFVLFSLADSQGLMPAAVLEPLIAVVILSMAATPFMASLGDRACERLSGRGAAVDEHPEAESDKPVLIAGFGRVGETVAVMLRRAAIPCVAIDMNADTVRHGRRRGFDVVYGNASRPEVLRAVGAQHARLMVVTLDNPHAAEGMLRAVHRQYPAIPIHVRARDWDAADKFTALGADQAVPETLEASLFLGDAALAAAGVDDDERRVLFEDLRAENYAKMRRPQ